MKDKNCNDWDCVGKADGCEKPSGPKLMKEWKKRNEEKPKTIVLFGVTYTEIKEDE